MRTGRSGSVSVTRRTHTGSTCCAGSISYLDNHICHGSFIMIIFEDTIFINGLGGGNLIIALLVIRRHRRIDTHGLIGAKMRRVGSRTPQHGSTPGRILLFLVAMNPGQGNGSTWIHGHGFGILAIGKQTGRAARITRDGRSRRMMALNSTATGASTCSSFLWLLWGSRVFVIVTDGFHRHSWLSWVGSGWWQCPSGLGFVIRSLRFHRHHGLESLRTWLVHDAYLINGLIDGLVGKWKTA